MALQLLANANLTPGTVFAGHYRIVRCLGRGSMGVVFSCRDLNLANRLVAVKILYPEVICDPVASERFYREIVLTYSIDNPYVVAAYDCFKDGDLFGFAMEYVDGGDLGKLLDRKKTLPIPEVTRLLAELCSGLGAIHSIGIVHRDIKPENVLLTKSRHVKLTDLGIAKNPAASRLTEHATLIGSIDYVSPEYLAYGGLDERADIYALGVLAYRMITGRTPSTGKHLVEVLANRVRYDPPAPSTIRGECPAELDGIVLKALARDPSERYQTAADIEKDLRMLERLGSGQPTGKIANAVWDSWRLISKNSWSNERLTRREVVDRAPPAESPSLMSSVGGDLVTLRRRLLQSGGPQLLQKKTQGSLWGIMRQACYILFGVLVTVLCLCHLIFNQPQKWLSEHVSSKPSRLVRLAKEQLALVLEENNKKPAETQAPKAVTAFPAKIDPKATKSGLKVSKKAAPGLGGAQAAKGTRK